MARNAGPAWPGIRTRGLDVIVRDEIRRTLSEELAVVFDEADRATAALTTLRRRASLRIGLMAVLISVASVTATLAATAW